MIQYATGDMFALDADALVNPVNTDGIMGGGLAAVFKRKHPELNEAYQRRCAIGLLRVGTLHVWRSESVPYQVVNLPTIGALADGCSLDIVARSLERLVEAAEHYGWAVVGVPALGCGIGGLRWEDVMGLYSKYLERSSTLFMCFEPQ